METKEQVQELLKTTEELTNKLKQVEEQKAAAINGAPYIATASGDCDEKRAMRAFKCSHVKDLLSVNTEDSMFRNVPVEYKQIVRDLKQDVDTARVISQIFRNDGLDRVGANESLDVVSSCKSIVSHYFGKNVLAPKLKAFGSTVVGGGDEWVPTLISSNYIPELILEHSLESKFVQVDCKSNPFQLPVQSGTQKARKATENTAATGSNFTTSALTFSAQKFVEYHELPEDLNEDSAVSIIPAAREHVVLSQKRAVESAIINGDNDGTHIDSDTQAGAADLAEKAFRGLRRQALAASSIIDFANAAVTTAKLRDMRALAKKYGVNPLDLVWVCDPAVYAQLLDLDQVSTLEKFGPQATVFKGALDIYKGIPIVVSEHMRTDLNATGVYDGVTTNRGGILLVNTKYWYVGTRRPIKVYAQMDLPSQDRWLLASYQRKDFQGLVQSASLRSAIYGYNIAV